MLEEGNPTLISRDPDHYNISKFRMMHRILSEFLGPANSEPSVSQKFEPLYTFLVALPHHHEESLFCLTKEEA